MRVVVTGGAGFVGSHLATALVEGGNDTFVLDSLATGRRDNVPGGATFIEGSVDEPSTVASVMRGAELVFHLGALGAVARSVDDPLTTDSVNTRGTLCVLKGASDAGVRRVVFASSSSVYGGSAVIPTPESAVPVPRSPYAVTKLSGEHYCRVFAELYGIETVALRYFNVFGPRQRPDSAYAAVIPLFIDAMLNGRAPEVHGDGRQSRDFTYVADVVDANLKAAAAPAGQCSGRVFNIAPGRPQSLLDLLDALERIIGVAAHPVFGPTRPGDIRDSCADPALARAVLNSSCDTSFSEGLERTVEWMRTSRRSR
jgi:UDP-glucose 4-epimerase